MRQPSPGLSPNPLQLQAICAPIDTAQKIVAGAGTGKTATMVGRFAHLVEHHDLDPNRILAVTFTNKAAGELRDRVTSELVGGGLVADRAVLDSAWIGTFHALCVRLLREDAYTIGFDRDVTVIDQLEERLLVQEVLRALRDGEVPGAGILQLEGIGVAGAMRLSSETFGFMQKMKGMGFGPDALELGCGRAAVDYWRDLVGPDGEGGGAEKVAEEEAGRLICATYREYERRLVQRRALDFDGILLTAREALRSHPDWAEACRDRFQYLIVDEFQDTNRVQLEVVELLARPGFSNVSVVGDPKQSIYGWRDAEIRNILEFAGHPHQLTANYRSVQPILDAAASIIRLDPEFAGEPVLRSDGRPGDSAAVWLYRAESPEEEARFLASRILEAHEGGRAWSDIAILTRMRVPPVAFEQELRRARIPYVTGGGHGFFEREEIKDVMAYLGVIDDPLNDQALVRMLQGPVVRVTDGELHRLFKGRSRANGIYSGWDALVLGEEGDFSELEAATADRVREALSLVRRHMAEKAGVTTSELVHAILEDTGYLRLAGADPSESDRRLANLRKLYRMATEFEARQVFSGLREFLEYVELNAAHRVEIGEAEDTGADAVRFMTVHSAKGLEFPVVFLAHLKPFWEQHRGWLFYDEDMGLILRNLGEKQETGKHAAWREARAGQLPVDLERAELRRLIYVAVTRAKDQIVISATRRDEPDWESVLSGLDARGNPRQNPDDDHFRTLALFASQGGGTLLPTMVVGEQRTPVTAPGEGAEVTAPELPLPEPSTPSRPVSAKPSRIEVSFSELEALIQCPLRYRYIYEWRLPAPPDRLWPQETTDAGTASVAASTLGTLVHETLQAFHFRGPTDGMGGLARLRDFWDRAAAAVISAELADRVWEREAAPMMERYLTLDLASFSTLATEQEFNLVETIAGTEVLIRGFIDRLCSDGDGRTVLVDYKTNRAIGTEAGASYARQLAIYQRAARTIFDLDPKVALVELRKGIVHRPGPDAAWRSVVELLTELVGGKREAPADAPCWACAYRLGCASSRVSRHPEGSAPAPGQTD